MDWTRARAPVKTEVMALKMAPMKEVIESTIEGMLIGIVSVWNLIGFGEGDGFDCREKVSLYYRGDASLMR